MLQAIRSNVTSWFVKILFVLLIASFAVWGIGDLFRDASPSDTVITVGNTEISAQFVDRRFSAAFADVQLQRGGEYTRAAAVEDGLLDEVIDSLVDRLALAEYAAQIGLHPPDSLVSNQIRRIGAFSDPATGQFSRDRFLSILRSQGLSEAQFVADQANQINQTILTLSAARGAIAPDTLTDPIYRLRYEGRVVDLVSLSEGSIQVPEPSDSELRSFHSANPDLFQAPEYRRLSLVTLRPEDLAEEVAVDEEDLREWYDRRIDEYATPERRDVSVVNFDTLQEAEAFLAALDETGDWDTALDSMDGFFFTETREAQSEVQFSPDLGAAVFAAELGDVAGPAQAEFGVAVARVDRVLPEEIPEFQEVAEEVEADLRLDRSYDVLFELSNELEDEIAAGATLAEAADIVGLTVTDTPPLSRQGDALDGAAPDLPILDNVLEVAFTLLSGESSLVESADDGSYFIVRVDAIQPPRPLPFDQVSDAVAEAWAVDAAERIAAAEMQEAERRLGLGQAAEVAARAIGGTARTTDPLLRDGSNADGLAGGIVDQAFDLALGDVASADLGDTQVAFRVAEIIPADPAEPNENWMAAVSADVENGLSTDLIQQFRWAARDAVDVDIDRDAIVSLLLGE